MRERVERRAGRRADEEAEQREETTPVRLEETAERPEEEHVADEDRAPSQGLAGGER
jgi:hypothetical protein